MPNAKLPPAIFASTTNRAVFDLPWLDFAWYFPKRPHKLRTPPWSKLHSELVAAGGSVPWESKIELAMHTGNVGSPYRKLLTQVAAAHPEEVLVNELFIGDHGKIRSTCKDLGLHEKGGFQQHKCFMPFIDQVRLGRVRLVGVRLWAGRAGDGGLTPPLPPAPVLVQISSQLGVDRICKQVQVPPPVRLCSPLRT